MEMLCIWEVCTTSNGWAALVLLATWAGVVWAFCRDGAVGW